MFDWPLLLPGSSLYAALRVNPTASQQEIRDAKAAIIKELESRKNAIDKQVAAVFAQVEGLQDQYKVVDALRKSETRDSDALSKALNKLADLEQRAVAIAPHFTAMLKHSDDLDKKIKAQNRSPLTQVQDRADYDRRRPPFALLKLADCSRDAFAVEQRLTLALLRREIASALEDDGEVVFYPSDWGRPDFTQDFCFNALLDEE